MNWAGERIVHLRAVAPDHAFLFDEGNRAGFTFGQVYELSGRVYAYLKEKGVGREDFVLVNLPRGVQPFIAVLGVWRAGAAVTIVENTYAPDRIAFIRKDCAAKAEIDAAAWERIMVTPPRDGFEDVGDHDAAYAVYTSGTTGTPKGVLHEYGNLRETVESRRYRGAPISPDDERAALTPPLNFVASMQTFIASLAIEAGELHVLSYHTGKDPALLRRTLSERRITLMFMTPSYIRTFGVKAGSHLKRVLVGGEPANGVCPAEDVEVYNCYGMSESGFLVGVFRIDRAYETCPVGSPQFGKRVFLADEEGREIDGDGIGELCFDNPYVRGYVNRPTETARAFRDGVYHSGDLARRLSSGDYVILGRNTDMVKINGNRVEPAEVEAAVCDVLGIDWCAVRGFEDDSQAFLAAYYTADVKVDAQAVREKLSRRLPYYMLPQYFIRIDDVPLTASRKLDRKALPRPKTEDYVAAYVAPSNDVEKALCDAMAKTLDLDRVGVGDDFYVLGGDSLKTMQVVLGCGLPGLTAADVFGGRTPSRIAAAYLACHAETGDPAEADEKARAVAHRLSPEQKYMVDYQFYSPLSTMYNLFVMLKTEKDRVDPERFAAAVTAALRNHPSLATVLEFNDEGDVVQRYRPEVAAEVKVERIDEFDFGQMKDDLVKPYKLIGSRLCRCRLFETGKNLYLFFDVHHVVFDGTSFGVFMRDIAKAYAGEPLERDTYYLVLQQRESGESSAAVAEDRRYFLERYHRSGRLTRLPHDFDPRENTLGGMEQALDVGRENLERFESAYRISRNEFFIVVCSLALAFRTGRKDIEISWIYNGRDNAGKQAVTGLLFRTMPIAFDFREDMELAEIAESAREQVVSAIKRFSVYSPVSEGFRPVVDDTMCILYQGSIHDVGVRGLGFRQVEIRQNRAASQTTMDIELLDGAEGLCLAMNYAASCYRRESVEAMFGMIRKVIRVLADRGGSPATFADIREAVSRLS